MADTLDRKPDLKLDDLEVESFEVTDSVESSEFDSKDEESTFSGLHGASCACSTSS